MTFSKGKSSTLDRVERSICGGTAEETQKWLDIYERLLSIERAETQQEKPAEDSQKTEPEPPPPLSVSSGKPEIPEEWKTTPELESEVNQLVDQILKAEEEGVELVVDDDLVDIQLREFLKKDECSTTEAIRQFELKDGDKEDSPKRKWLRDLMCTNQILGRKKVSNAGKIISYSLCPRSLFLFLNKTTDPRLRLNA